MRYRRPNNTSFTPRIRQSSCITEGCLYRMIPVLIVLAVALFFAMALHPQGFPLIPWLIDHL